MVTGAKTTFTNSSKACPLQFLYCLFSDCGGVPAGHPQDPVLEGPEGPVGRGQHLSPAFEERQITNTFLLLLRKGK